METFTDEVMRDLLARSLDTAALGAGGWRDNGRGPGSTEAGFIDWLTIRDQAESVRADVRRIRAHPLVSPAIILSGHIYDVRTGRLLEVPEAVVPGIPAGVA
jgi:carbonic anhydrase